MKTVSVETFLQYSVLLVLACGIRAIAASPQAPEPVSLSIATDTNITVTVNDPANHVWIVEQSSDFQEWFEVGAWKVYNGNFHGSFTVAAPSGFFRAWYD